MWIAAVVIFSFAITTSYVRFQLKYVCVPVHIVLDAKQYRIVYVDTMRGEFSIKRIWYYKRNWILR